MPTLDKTQKRHVYPERSHVIMIRPSISYKKHTGRKHQKQNTHTQRLVRVCRGLYYPLS